MNRRTEVEQRRQARLARERKIRRRTEGLAIAGGGIIGLIFLLAIITGLLMTLALAAFAGDVLGLWEVVEFV